VKKKEGNVQVKKSFEYRIEAKEIMKGNYGNIILTHIVMAIIAGLPSGIGQAFEPKYEVISWFPFERVLIDAGNPAIVQVFNLISFILSAIVMYSIMRMYITLTKEKTNTNIEEIVKVGFIEQPIRSVIHSFIATVFTFLWTLLFVIPGIMAAYKYAMGFYLLNKESTLSAYDAIDKSKQLMMGNRMRLFSLDLSYLGWYILGLFTLGILWLWIIPKHLTARVLFFNEIYPVEKITETSIT
jgi:uncharacterized membrane protein